MITEDNHLCIWVIYKDAIDTPPGYFIRRWVVHPGREHPEPDPYGVQALTLEQARECIRENVGILYRMDRSPTDDPCIVESWL